MTKYEVGNPFPFPHPMPGAEVTLSDISTAFFDVKCYLHDIAPDEIKDWRKGILKYGFFEYDKCLFFIIAFENWNLDCSINILKIKSDEDLENWLNADGNLINIFLIDAGTNILKAMRTFSIPVDLSESVKDILEQQTEKYNNHEEVEKRIAEIQHSITTDEMIKRTKMYKL